jgi:hypothetical protein
MQRDMISEKSGPLLTCRPEGAFLKTETPQLERSTTNWRGEIFRYTSNDYNSFVSYFWSPSYSLRFFKADGETTLGIIS